MSLRVAANGEPVTTATPVLGAGGSQASPIGARCGHCQLVPTLTTTMVVLSW